MSDHERRNCECMACGSYIPTREELFNAPFNLAGELIDNGLTAEGEKRATAEAETEARKAQLTMSGVFPILTGNQDSASAPNPFGRAYSEGIHKPASKLHAPYVGPWPRKRHSHRCDKCGHRVACYKSKCGKGSRVALCNWCGGR